MECRIGLGNGRRIIVKKRDIVALINEGRVIEEEEMTTAGSVLEGLLEPWSSVSFDLGEKVGVAFHFQRGNGKLVDPLEGFLAFVIGYSAFWRIDPFSGFKSGDPFTGAFEFLDWIAAAFDGIDGFVD